jgi:RHS repeat-associated protein
LTSAYYNLGGFDRFQYDAAGKIVRFESPIAKYDFTYTASGLLASILDGAGGLTRLEYDGALDKPSRIISPVGSVEHFQYNSYGQLTQYTDPIGAVTRVEYDAQGRVQKQTDANGGALSVAYDSTLPDLPSRVTNRIGQVTYYTYDDAGRLTTLQTPGGAITSYEYDADGNRTAVVDPATNRYEFKYDAMSRLIEEADPLGKRRVYSYDLGGNRTNSVDRLGRQRSFVYDALGRMTQERWHEPASNAIVRSTSYGYDFANRLNSASDPDATINPFWFGTTRGPMLSETAAYSGMSSRRIAYTYDAVGRRTHLNVAVGTFGALSFDYVRDLAGQLRIITSSTPLPPSTISNNAFQIQFYLNARGDVTELRRFSDANGANRVSQTFITNSESCSCNVSGISHVIASNQPLPDATLVFTRNPDGAITSLSEGTNSVLFSFDGGGRLNHVTRNGAASESYSYDSNGNRTASHLHGTYTTDAGNRVSQAGAWTLTYDFEGNLVTKSNTATGDVFKFTWDYRNRLTHVLRTNTAQPAATEFTEFRYDPLNRRIAVIKNSQTNWTYYDHTQPLVDYVNTNTVPSGVFGSGEKPDELHTVWNINEGMFWTLTDQIGSVRRVLDAKGTNVTTLNYDSYGNLLSATGSNPDAAGRFAFAGREFDADTGLYFNRARYYDPELGRFISEDPVRFEGGEANLYRYARNNPLKFRDPTGTVALIEYVSVLQNRLEAACKLGAAVKTLYMQVFTALSLAESLSGDALDGLPDALASLAGFSVDNPLDPLEEAAKDKLADTLGLGDIADLLELGKTVYECSDTVSGAPQ